MTQSKQSKATKKSTYKKRIFPLVRTSIRAGVVNYGAPNGGEEDVIWSWNEGYNPN